jgi:superfamily II DNA/RNA helicase
LSGCGHIVFAQRTAAHLWFREVLVRRGIPRERIAVVNASTTNADQRQVIANAFRGVGGPAKYDVVIGNSTMEEGINLQDRACAVHHLDLPWEPATLQQRNGRGVRQGNKRAKVKVFYYYLSERSFDGYRLKQIDGKESWVASLIEGKDREIEQPRR